MQSGTMRLLWPRQFSSTSRPALVSPSWLGERLSDVRVLDCSWYLPTMERDGRAEFEARRIPGAFFFDIDDVCDKSSPLPHTLPSVEDFAEAVTHMGICSNTEVVCYDGIGLFSAPRVWWMFKHFGLTSVSVLDGGFPSWKRAGYPLDTAEPSKPTPTTEAFRCTSPSTNVWTYADVVQNSGAVPILDARSAARFHAQSPEPRPGLPSGHIPGSANVPLSSLCTENMESLRPEAELKAILESYLDKEVTVSCGSGVSACVIALAIHETYGESEMQVNLYDGSWCEYAANMVQPKLHALLDALAVVGDPEIQLAMSKLTAKPPLLAPGLESLMLAVDTRLENISSWPGQEAETLQNIKALAQDLQEEHAI